MAYGYGVSMTPLQTLTFYNAIANSGEMVKPRFIEKIGAIGELPQQIFRREILNPSICSNSTIKKVKNMMFNDLDKEWGTANNIKDKDFAIAGKTGTSQVDYSRDDKEVQYISSFVGYFPADKPKYSCIVVIHRPNKKLGYYGSTVAAPVFKKIAKKIYTSTPEEVYLDFNKVRSLSTDLMKINSESKYKSQ